MAEISRQAGIFIDVENVRAWIREGGLGNLFATLVSDFGAVVYRRAYAAWSSQCGECLRPLNQWGFEMINVYHPVSGKNSADIQIVVDVMEVLDRRPDLASFVLVTGDSDFSPLFRRLRERGKLVVGVGPESSLSETVKSSCDRFIYTGRRVQPAVARPRSPGAPARPSGAAQSAGTPVVDAAEQQAENTRVRAEAARLVRSLLPRDGTPIHLADLKKRVLELDSAFDEKIPGTFLRFLRSVHEDEWHLDNPAEGDWRIALVEPDGEGETEEAPSETVATREQYESFLRQKSWRFTTRAGLDQVYRALVAAGDQPLGRAEIEERLMQSIEEETLSREALSAALHALFAIGACQRGGGSNEGGTTTNVVRDLTDEELVRRHDVAVLARLCARCSERNVDFVPAVAQGLLLGAWNSAELDALAAEGRLATEAHRAQIKARGEANEA